MLQKRERSIMPHSRLKYPERFRSAAAAPPAAAKSRVVCVGSHVKDAEAETILYEGLLRGKQAAGVILLQGLKAAPFQVVLRVDGAVAGTYDLIEGKNPFVLAHPLPEPTPVQLAVVQGSASEVWIGIEVTQA